MSHTPGPWIARDRTVGHPPRRVAIEINAPIGVGRMEHPICRVPSGSTNQDDDARLIAAAPELFEACLALLAGKDSSEVWDLAWTAVMKAHGREPVQRCPKDIES